ncbi:hypothetical protein KY284_020292 [Solanum tuberosum]|nr:hypothetical protein KY284_020292 [Solanum tuberosum]
MASNNLPLNPPFTFTSENYQIWSVKMQAFLEAYELWETVTEHKPLAALPANPTLAQIKSNNEEKAKKSKAKSLMQNDMADSMFYRIMACKTAKEAWDRLKEEYQGSDRTRQMQVLNLKREFECLNMQDDETISKYADRISLIVNNIRLLGEEFIDKRIVEKVLVTLLERFESKISSLEESKDLGKLSLGELMSALQAQEQMRTMRRDKFTEGAFSVQKQLFGKGKQQVNQNNKTKHDGGNNSGDVKKKFLPCKHCKRTTHLEKYCWWRVDAICGNCKQTGHISKVCKSRAKASGCLQAQVAEAADAHEEQLFVVSYFSINESSDS